MKMKKYQLVLIGLLSFILIFSLEYLTDIGFKYVNIQFVIEKAKDVLPTFILVYGLFVYSRYKNKQ